MPSNSASPTGARSRPRPRRQRLVDEVRDLIAQEFIIDEAVSGGERLPSEHELSERYGVSRVTVRASLRSLHDAGLISVRHGVGATVLPRSRATVTHGLDRLLSIEQLARETGLDIETADVEWAETRADADLARRLDVPVGHPVLVVERAKTLGDTRVAWLRDLVPQRVLPFENLSAEFTGSVLDVLLTHDELGVAYEDLELEPVNLSADIARRLSVKAGTAALFMDAVTRDDRGRVVEWAQSWLLPQYFRFSIRRRR